MNLHINPGIARRIVDLIYEISGCLVVIENDNDVIASSTDTRNEKVNDADCHQYHFNISESLIDKGHSKRSIAIAGKTLGTITIWGSKNITDVLATLASEFIVALVQESANRQELDHRLREYENLFNLVPAQIWYKDTQNRFMYVNKQVEKDIGIPAQSFEGRHAEELFPEYSEKYYRDDLEVIYSGQPKLDIVEQIKNSKGEIRWVNANKVPTTDSMGNVTGLIALVKDITESKTIDEQLRIWAKVFESSGEAISVTDSENHFVVVNQAFSDATGYSYDEIVGKEPSILKSGMHDEMFYQNMWASINQTGSWEGEIWERRKDGIIYPKWLKINQIKDSEGNLTNYLATFTDISERKVAEERIDFLNRHDALTGLPNRKVLGEKIDVELERARLKKRRVGILSIDLDRFKNINDSLGHQIGDEFLKEIAKRLESCSPNMVARFGGDAFIVILSDVYQKEEIVGWIQKTLSLIAKPFYYKELELMATASIGVSIFPDDGEVSNVLIRNADTAMHQAKDGHNSYQFFTETMNEDASERLILETSLWRALEKNEFVLFYQPQVDCKTEKVIGVEALIRWNHPTKGVISPAEFIPILEETGLIIPIGRWVLMEACRQHREWIDIGLPPIPISVNISSVQFHDDEFLQTLAHAVRDSGIEPSYLDLEVTESVVMRKPEFVIHQLESIKKMGMRLSLDDFGTGFSSLSYLRYFPLDRIKIDQSFIRGLEKTPVNQAIIETVISLGKSLKIKTIAEGIETKQELERLRELQCDEIQGYYFSRPLSSGDLIKWIRAR